MEARTAPPIIPGAHGLEPAPQSPPPQTEQAPMPIGTILWTTVDIGAEGIGVTEGVEQVVHEYLTALSSEDHLVKLTLRRGRPIYIPVAHIVSFTPYAGAPQ
jgi:hypothetical protein